LDREGMGERGQLKFLLDTTDFKRKLPIYKLKRDPLKVYFGIGSGKMIYG